MITQKDQRKTIETKEEKRGKDYNLKYEIMEIRQKRERSITKLKKKI